MHDKGNFDLEEFQESFPFQFVNATTSFAIFATALAGLIVIFTHGKIAGPILSGLMISLLLLFFLIRTKWLPSIRSKSSFDRMAVVVFFVPNAANCLGEALKPGTGADLSISLVALAGALGFFSRKWYFFFLISSLVGFVVTSVWVNGGVTKFHYKTLILTPTFAILIRLATEGLSKRVKDVKQNLRNKIEELEFEQRLREKTQKKLDVAKASNLISVFTLDQTATPVLVSDLTDAFGFLDSKIEFGLTLSEIETGLLHDDLIFEFRDHIEMIDANEKLVKVLGFDSVHDCLTRFEETFVEKSMAAIRRHAVSIYRREEFECECIHRNLKTGEEVYVQIQSRPITQNNRTYCVTTLADISEQVQLKHQLVESESRKQMALNANNAGIFELEIHKNQSTHFYGSESLYKLLKMDHKSLDGHIQLFADIVHPSDLEKSLEPFKSYVSRESKTFKRTLRLKTGDGTYRWFRERIGTSESDSAGIWRSVGTISDVHEETRKQNLLNFESDLLKAKGEFQEILSNYCECVESEFSPSNFGILLVGKNSQQISSCISLSKKNLLEKVFLGTILHENKNSIKRHLEDRMIRDGIGLSDQMRFEFVETGNQIRAIIVLFGISKDDSQLQNSTEIITKSIQLLLERKIQNEKEEEFNSKVLTEDRLESLGKLAGGIAHDFNNLLTVISTNAELVELKTNQRDILESTSQVSDAVTMASGLCQKMLTYAGESQFELKEINISELAAGVVDMVRSGTAGQNSFVEQYASSLPKLVGDRAMLGQLVLNLLTNAVESSTSRQSISITTGLRKLGKRDFEAMYFADELEPGTYVFLRVSDKGDGIARENIQRIFDPFFTTKETGTGLGLATVIGAVRRHNGCVSLDSKKQVGTTFVVYFPVEISTEDESDSKRIAIIDDNDAVRKSIEKLLTVCGYSVIPMASGEEAIQRIVELATCDALMLDQQMPGMNGLETYTAIRQSLRSLPICFISGYKIEDELIQIVHQDSKCLSLSKPFGLEKINNSISLMLGRNAQSNS